MSSLSRFLSAVSKPYGYEVLSPSRRDILLKNNRRRSLLRLIFLIVALVLMWAVKGRYVLPLALMIVVSANLVGYVIERSRGETTRQLIEAERLEKESKTSEQTSAS